MQLKLSLFALALFSGIASQTTAYAVSTGAGPDVLSINLLSIDGQTDHTSFPFSGDLAIHCQELLLASAGSRQLVLDLQSDCSWDGIVELSWDELPDGVELSAPNRRCHLPGQLIVELQQSSAWSTAALELQLQVDDGFHSAQYSLQLPLSRRDAPQLSVSTGEDGIRLSWSGGARGTGYQVHKSCDPWFEPSAATMIASTVENFWIEPQLPLDVASFYRVVPEEIGSTVIDLVRITPGHFRMGEEESAEQPHLTTLNSAYEIGRFEIRNDQYLECLNWAYSQGMVSLEGEFVRAYGHDLLRVNGAEDRYEIRHDEVLDQFVLHVATADNGTDGPGHAYPDGYDVSRHPVSNVSWYGAACFCDWSSLRAGLTPFYAGEWNQTVDHNPYSAEGFRLPTQAEWEHAAGWMDSREYPWGDESPDSLRANYLSPDGGRGWSAPVGSYPEGATRLGLFDMGGNLWEWCGDVRAEYDSSAVVDPLGPETGPQRAGRGGGWNNDWYYLRCSTQSGSAPENTIDFVGFRVARTVNVERARLSAHYALDSNGLDQSGHGLDADSLSGDFAADRFGHPDEAWHTDGSALIELPMIEGPAATICFWIKPDSIITVIQGRSGVMGDHTGPPATQGIQLGPWTSAVGQEVVTLSTGENMLNMSVWTSDLVEQVDPAWHHVALIWNPCESAYRLLFDGIDKGMGVMPGSTSLVHDPVWQIGQFNTAVFQGLVDDVRFYADPLAPWELRMLVHEGGWWLP